jgi:peroxiredoxin
MLLRQWGDVGARRRGRNMPGVKIDAAAPDFELNDFNGAAFRLSDLRGSANVLLVFNRGFT